MKAYHVYLMRTQVPANGGWQQPFETEMGRRKFELLTHMYSCINHKAKNPDIPLVLVTDKATLKYYDEWRLTGLYDEVITDLHDDYPRDRISQHLWASPKIWAMKKLRAPFIVFDTDIVLHKPLTTYRDCDLLYLHRETSTIYPNPYDVAAAPGFEWDAAIIDCFRSALPMNCAVVGMFNEDFKRDYVNRYFEFALDAPGHVLYATDASRKFHPWSSGQIIAEQWLLAALALKWKKYDQKPLRTCAVVKALWASEEFWPLDLDEDASAINEELTASFYHLWGAKKIQNDPTNTFYERVRATLLGGRHIVEQSPQYEIVKPVYDRIIAGVIARE